MIAVSLVLGLVGELHRIAEKRKNTDFGKFHWCWDWSVSCTWIAEKRQLALFGVSLVLGLVGELHSKPNYSVLIFYPVSLVESLAGELRHAT